MYNSVGSKRSIVAAINDFIDAEAGIGAMFGQARSSRDPELVATLSTRVACSVVRHAGDLIAIVVFAAQIEPELAALLEEDNRRHIAGNQAIAEVFSDMGLLRPGLDAATAGQALAAINEEQYILALRNTYGWSMGRIEEWLLELTRQQVLNERA